MRLFLVIALVIAVFAVIFALQNLPSVTVVFLIFQVKTSLALVLLTTFVLGILVGLLVLVPTTVRQKLKLSKNKKRMAELEEELNKNLTTLTSQRKRIETLEQNLNLE